MEADINISKKRDLHLLSSVTTICLPLNKIFTKCTLTNTCSETHNSEFDSSELDNLEFRRGTCFLKQAPGEDSVWN